MSYTTRRERRLAERAAAKKQRQQRVAAGALSVGVLFGAGLATSTGAVAAPVTVLASPTGTASTTTWLNMRSGAGVSHSVITVLSPGTTVTKTGTASGSWLKVTANGRTGWVSSAYLTSTGTSSTSTSTASAGTAQTTAAGLNFRTGPGTGYSVISVLSRGTTVTKTGSTTAYWTQVTVNGRTGWVSTSYITSGSTSTSSSTTTPIIRTASVSSSWKATAANWATAKASDPYVSYVWGGNGPSGYDCSGFTKAAFEAAGKTLPRTSRYQYTSANQIVSLSNIQVGDLVFWSNNGSSSGIYHVAIYIGNGKIAHARNPQMGVTVTDLYYSRTNMLGTAARYN